MRKTTTATTSSKCKCNTHGMDGRRTDVDIDIVASWSTLLCCCTASIQAKV